MELLKTKEQVDDLKWSWHRDPCWDIEDTEGFEAYREELLFFRLEQEQIWKDQWAVRISRKAEKLGLNPELFSKLVEHIIFLENRIQKLEDTQDE